MDNLEQKARFADNKASDYDKYLPQCVPGYFELEESMGKRIAAKYTSPKVIDLGVGTGITTLAVLHNVPGAVVTGIDSEPRMVVQATAKLKDRIGDGQVKIVQANILNYLTRLPPSRIDVVTSSCTLHNCSIPYRALVEKQIFRVLRSGGMFINDDKYAVDNELEYFNELAKQACRYNLLVEQGRGDLQYDWIRHEFEDQRPDRIMRVGQSLKQLNLAGFTRAEIVERIGQYAIMTAYKP